MVERKNSTPLMPEEHIEALRAVDLNLYFGVHGTREKLPDYGPAVIGSLTDEEYARAAQMITPLKADRGDVLAYEAVSYVGDWRSTTFLRGATTIASESIYTTKTDIIREVPSASSICLGPRFHIETAELMEFAEEARRLRIFDPIDYAVLLAIAKDVPCTRADASKYELDAWHESMKEGQRQLGLLGRLSVGESLWYDAEQMFRDKKMAERLGSIASAMEVHDPDDPPHLSFIAGEDHRPGVTRLLAVNEIPFTQHELTPDYAKYLSIRRRKDFFAFWVPFAKSLQQKDIEAWIANARAVVKGRS